jgi:hypothetical protein
MDMLEVPVEGRSFSTPSEGMTKDREQEKVWFVTRFNVIGVLAWACRTCGE